MRELITRELIEKKGFNFVGIEGDWPDAARIDHYVRHFEYRTLANGQRLRAFQPGCGVIGKSGISSIGCVIIIMRSAPISGSRFTAWICTACIARFNLVLEYLKDVDPETAKVARRRYGCLDAMGIRSGDLRPRGIVRALIKVAKKKSSKCSPNYWRNKRTIRRRTANVIWTRCKMPNSSPMPKSTTA